MKNKLKKLLRFGFALFTIGLFLTNCEKENAREEPIQVENQEPTFTLKHYSRKNIEKNTKLVSKLKEFNDKAIENKSAKYSGKNVYNKEYDFTIYTDSATYIQNGDYHSYTFPIIQGADEKITNVLFELNDQNEYDAFLVRYDYSANELKYQDFNSLSMKTSMKPIDLDFNSLFARTKSAYVCVYSYEYVRTGSHFTNGDSNLIEFDYGWVLTAGYCETVLYYDEDYKEYHEGNMATITIGGTTYGGTGGSTTSPTPSPFDSEELIKIDIVKNRLGLNHPERLWIDKWENGQYAFQLYDLLKINLFSAEAIAFAKNAIALDMLLSTDHEIASTGKLPEELDSCCPGDCCPDVSLYSNDRIVYEYGIQPVVAFIDGSFNLIIGTSELIGSDAWVGSRIRKMMIEIGIDVPADIDNEHLSELYRIRKRDNVVVVEYRPGLLKSMLDVGLDTLDVLAFLSPAKGGGPVLFAKIGGSVSITSISNHIRDITVTSIKIDNAVNNLKNNAKYVLEGTGEFKNVGGHHPLAKIAFNSDKFYDLQKAFSVSANSLGGQSVHYAITGNQNRLYSAFAKTGEVLTIEKMADIEIKAMVDAGIPSDIAAGWVVKALEDLKSQGVKVITNIPWNGLN